MKPNVLQHQYAITDSRDKECILSTKGICICSGWYGWDSKNKIYFLCHFDSPFSANSTPNIIMEILKYAPNEHSFKSILVGGKRRFWSKCTRNIVKQYVNGQNELNIVVRDGPFDNGCAKRDLVISSQRGRITNQKLEGKSYLDGFCWFLGPMERVEVNS